jgi:hypothetical protein
MSGIHVRPIATAAAAAFLLKPVIVLQLFTPFPRTFFQAHNNTTQSHRVTFKLDTRLPAHT